MLSPEQVVPFLQHADPIVVEHAHRYFRETVDFGPLTAEHYWAVLDRLGENDASVRFAADLPRLPQTDESLRRLINAFASPASELFEFHFQHAARDMQLDFLLRHRAELLAIPQLLPHVREHMELRLRLLDESPAAAWDRLMRHGRELGGAYAYSFNTGLSEALVEAAGRGGTDICEKAMAMLEDASAANDWRRIFAVRVLGEARHEPAIDALVEKFAIDADVLRQDVTAALSRIGTPRVIHRIVGFFPGKPWHVRLYAHSPLVRIKRPESETALLQLLEMESSLEAHPQDDEGASLVDSILLDLTELGSLTALEQSRRFIADSPDDPEADDLCECLIATAIMNGVTLPEEADYRKRVTLLYKRAASGRAAAESLLGGTRENWRKTGMSFPPTNKNPDETDWYVPKSALPSPAYYPPDRMAPIRNTSPKVGRNDPCPCGSGKKHKKCCGK